MFCIDTSQKLLASGGTDKSVYVWNVESKQKLYDVRHKHSVSSVVFKNSMLISASLDQTCKISKKDNGRLLQTLEHDGKCNNIDINGNMMAVAHGNNDECGGVSVWNIEDFSKIEEYQFKQITDVRFQSDSRIIFASNDGWIYKIELTKMNHPAKISL